MTRLAAVIGDCREPNVHRSLVPGDGKDAAPGAEFDGGSLARVEAASDVRRRGPLFREHDLELKQALLGSFVALGLAVAAPLIDGEAQGKSDHRGGDLGHGAESTAVGAHAAAQPGASVCRSPGGYLVQYPSQRPLLAEVARADS